jgi:hypothetical protein
MTTPDIEQTLLDKLHALSPEQQKAALEFVDSLAPVPASALAERPRRSLLGLCSDLHVRVSAEDIAEIRREVWGSLTRKSRG